MYEQKKNEYFSTARKEIIPMLPKTAESALEIGCGTGETLELLKDKYASIVTVGIELTEQAALLAKKKVDTVENLDVENPGALEKLGKFDIILLLDVLEHLRDPWTILDTLSNNNLTTNGIIITSIPNARNHQLLFRLIAGDFEYLNEGILDKTHLRFFTKRSMIRMIRGANLEVLECRPTNLSGNTKSSLANKITFGLFEEFLSVQYLIKSKRKLKS